MESETLARPDAVIVGRLTRDYLLPFERRPQLDTLGGSLAYATAGLCMWDGRAFMAARVTKDYPREWLGHFIKMGCDAQAVKVVEESFQERRFIAYTDPVTAVYENPLTYFAERQLQFPLELLGYDPKPQKFCSKTDYKGFSFHVNDIPRPCLEASMAHICPIDYISHKILPSILRSGMAQTISMRASSCYMDLSFWEEMRTLLSDLTIFTFTEAQGLHLFQGRSLDVWEIIEALATYGPEYILVNMTDGTTRLFDKILKKRWIIPAYPARVSDPTGSLDAFDGAFLVNYRKEYDPVDAALHAVITQSFAREGSGPYYILDSLPGLKEARLEALRPRVIAV